MPNTFYLKLFLFPSLLLLLTPETLPNHLFRQTNDQKLSRKLPKITKKNFLFFIIYFTFSLSPYGKKTKPLTFSAFFITGNRKTARENVPHKIFFFLFFFTFFCILPLLVIEKITTYLFFEITT